MHKEKFFQSRSGRQHYYVAKLHYPQPDRYYTYRVCNEGRPHPGISFRTYNQSTRNDYSFHVCRRCARQHQRESKPFFREAFATSSRYRVFVFGGDLTERQPNNAGRNISRTGFHRTTLPRHHRYRKPRIPEIHHSQTRTPCFSLVFSYYLDSMVGENQVYTLKYNDMQIFCRQ